MLAQFVWGREILSERKGRRTLWFGIGLIAIGLGSLALTWFSRDLLPAVGATLLGFIIGMLVGFFAQEAKEWTRSAMTASVAVLTGAGALALLRYGAPELHGVWFYPVGLVIGFGFGTIWEEIDPA
jgi:tetrahydromethanopterin S-methyltransferase subunit C